MVPRHLDTTTLRAVRIAAQRLPPRARRSARDDATAAGPLRTLGGVDVYLAAHARQPAMTRGDLDALVAEARLAIVPAMRGCIYLVAEEQAADCLRLAAELSRSRDERDAERAGIRAGELADVGAAVLEQLRGGGPLTTEGLRKALPAGSVRSLGDRGKKVGVSSTLPPALRRLEFAGRIRRRPLEARLDHERYVWSATDGAAPAERDENPTALHARFLERFLHIAAVGTLAQFCAWSGLTQRAAKAALATLDVATVTADGLDGEALASPDLKGLLQRVDAAADAVALLPFEDNLSHLAGGLPPFVDARWHDLPVPVWGKGRRQLAPLGTTSHTFWRPVVAAGRVRGFWEYDPQADELVTWLFDRPDARSRTAVAAAAERTAEFVRGLGHARSFSLDTDDELVQRAAALRRHAAQADGG
jgi:hypothetical protein